jgi:hypothetical protein
MFSFPMPHVICQSGEAVVLAKDFFLNMAITVTHFAKAHDNEMRELLVEPEGKKELEVMLGTCYDNSREFWEEQHQDGMWVFDPDI